ncbi:MAG: AraC family transcriptional regulator ligand-binding domain-containing protein [Stenotrophobium sp.]
MTALVRSDALRRFADLASELGGDAAALLRKARIPPETLRDGDNFVPFRSMLHLLELSAATLDCKDFALRLAARQDMEIFGPLALAAQNCATVGETVECFSKYFHTHNPALQIVTSQKLVRRTTLISFRILLPRPPLHPQFDERCVALAHSCLKLVSAGTYRPLRVLLPHSRLSAVRTYHDFFGCEMRFEQPLAALEIAASDLRKPVHSHNPQLHLIATAFLENLGAKPHSQLNLRVREAIGPLLPTGRCSHTSVASVFFLHTRTLQRRLAEEGTSFEKIKDEVRRDMAQQYLTTSTIPLSQITALLGYSEQSAMTRSCQRWFRRPPLALRGQSTRR